MEKSPIENAEIIEKKLAVGDVIVVNQIGFKLSTSLFIKLANFLKNGYKDRGWTHSAVYIGEGKIMEALAAPIGVVENNLRDTYLQGTHNFLILRHKNATEDRLRKVAEFCISEKGKKYDSRGIGYFLILNIIPTQLHFLLKIHSWGEKFNDKGKFFCSELVSRGFQEAGLYCFEEESYKIMPADFNNPLLFDVVHMQKKFIGPKWWRTIKDVLFCSMYFLTAFGIYSLMVGLILLIKKFFIGIVISIVSIIGLAIVSLCQVIQKKHATESALANKTETPIQNRIQ